MPIPLQRHMAACACGCVRFEAIGDPILVSACYCADCRSAAAQIAALPGAPPLAEPDGGTECVLYRKDRLAFTAGEDLLLPMKLDPASATKRMVARCCNSAMAMIFDDSRHWVSSYRRRFEGALPPIDMRICLGDARTDPVVPADAPKFKGYAPRMMLKLVGARMAMAFNKGETFNG